MEYGEGGDRQDFESGKFSSFSSVLSWVLFASLAAAALSPHNHLWNVENSIAFGLRIHTAFTQTTNSQQSRLLNFLSHFSFCFPTVVHHFMCAACSRRGGEKKVFNTFFTILFSLYAKGYNVVTKNCVESRHCRRWARQKQKGLRTCSISSHFQRTDSLQPTHCHVAEKICNTFQMPFYALTELNLCEEYVTIGKEIISTLPLLL